MRIVYERVNGDHIAFEVRDAVFRCRVSGELVPESDMAGHALWCDVVGVALDVELVSCSSLKEAA